MTHVDDYGVERGECPVCHLLNLPIVNGKLAIHTQPYLMKRCLGSSQEAAGRQVLDTHTEETPS